MSPSKRKGIDPEKNEFHMELYCRKRKGVEQWRWRYFCNDDIIAKGGEPFAASSIDRAVARLQDKIELYTCHIDKGRNGKWYWKATAKNGRVVAVGDKGYDNYGICMDYWMFFQETVWAAGIVKIHNGNHKVIGRVVDGKHN